MSSRITYVDKSTLNPSGVPENNKWSGSNGQEIKTVINSHADDIEALQAIGATILKEEIELTQAQIQTLKTTPIELIAAPGLGKIIQVSEITAYYVNNGTDYTGAGTLTAQYASGSGLATEVSFNASSGFVNNTTTGAHPEQFLRNASGRTQFENNAINIQLLGGSDPSEAGGTIKVFVQYEIIDAN